MALWTRCASSSPTALSIQPSESWYVGNIVEKRKLINGTEGTALTGVGPPLRLELEQDLPGNGWM